MSEKKQIKVNDILEYLKEGLTRSEIGEKLGLETHEVKHLFNHPSLKGKRTRVKKEISFEIVDDTQTIEELDKNEGISEEEGITEETVTLESTTETSSFGFEK